MPWIKKAPKQKPHCTCSMPYIYPSSSTVGDEWKCEQCTRIWRLTNIRPPSWELIEQEVVLIGGKYDNLKATIEYTPDAVLVGKDNIRYEAITDPDTGKFLGGYAFPYEGKFDARP